MPGRIALFDVVHIPAHLVERVLLVRGRVDIPLGKPGRGTGNGSAHRVPAVLDRHGTPARKRAGIVGANAEEVVIRPRRIRLSVYRRLAIVRIPARELRCAPPAFQNGMRQQVFRIDAVCPCGVDEGLAIPPRGCPRCGNAR